MQWLFKNDILFKMVFVKHPDLLKRLVAELLNIRLESIKELTITNPEMPPEVIGDKFCRLDINMTVDGQRVDLEIQVKDEGDYPERSLYHWAREYSAALGEGGDYADLPRAIVVSIVAFPLFDCPEFHSEFQLLEVTRHTPLTDRQVLHYFELPKLPRVRDGDDGLKLWLALFKAETEEELARIEAMEVTVMADEFAGRRSHGANHRIGRDLPEPQGIPGGVLTSGSGVFKTLRTQPADMLMNLRQASSSFLALPWLFCPASWAKRPMRHSSRSHRYSISALASATDRRALAAVS